MQTEIEPCWACDPDGASGSTVRVFVPWVSARFTSMVDHLLASLLQCEHRIELVDVTQFAYPRWSLNVEDLVDGLSLNSGIRVTVMHRGRITQSKPLHKADFLDWLGEASDSEIRTKYNGQLPAPLHWLGNLEAKLARKSAASLFKKLCQLEVKPDELWVYPNGRFAAQRAVLEAAKVHGFKSFCYEGSRFASKFYLRPYRSHDRVAGQLDYELGKSSVRQTSRQAVSTWIENRSLPKSTINPFAAKFRDESTSTKPPPKSIVFFTSSRDEFIGLGDQWSGYGWADQYEAFSALGLELRKQGFQTFIRTHPNLANKSLKDLKMEHAKLLELKQEGFTIIGPQNSANSYVLASSASAVVVSSSTIGIEALALGVPVLITANSYYDHLSNLIAIHRDTNMSVIRSSIEQFQPFAASEEALTWLAFNYEKDLPAGRIIQQKPGFAKSFRNAMHGDVFAYHTFALLVMAATHLGRKLLLRKIGHL